MMVFVLLIATFCCHSWPVSATSFSCSSNFACEAGSVISCDCQGDGALEWVVHSLGSQVFRQRYSSSSGTVGDIRTDVDGYSVVLSGRDFPLFASQLNITLMDPVDVTCSDNSVQDTTTVTLSLASEYLTMFVLAME